MKSGGTAKSRYDKLKPAVEQAFDLPGMTALSVGPTWPSIAPADQKALTEAFERMTVANYARNFDSFSGEKFIVDPAVTERGTDKFVKSTLKPASGDAIPFNYRLHEAGGSWKIVDIYLNGNISQLAQKRSDFGATLQASGPQGLAKKINALADQTLRLTPTVFAAAVAAPSPPRAASAAGRRSVRGCCRARRPMASSMRREDTSRRTRTVRVN